MTRRIIDIVLKVILSLILVMPVAGVTGILGETTRDRYNTDQAFAFIEMLTAVSYIMYTMAAVHVLALIAFWTRHKTLRMLQTRLSVAHTPQLLLDLPRINADLL